MFLLAFFVTLRLIPLQFIGHRSQKLRTPSKAEEIKISQSLSVTRRFNQF